MPQLQLSRAEITQSIKFQDAIGEIIDQWLRDGVRADIIQEVLRNEADSTPARQKELAA